MTINDKKGIIGTLIVHTLALMVFVFLGFITPLPLPSEEGILINFGDQPTGSGPAEPRVSEPASAPRVRERVVEQPVSASEAEEKVTTQNFEEAPAIEAAKSETETKKTNEVTRPVEKKPEAEEQPEEEPKVVDTRALYSGKDRDSESSASEGVTGDEGNQGNPFGSVDSPDYSLGQSQGSGGPSFSLAGRNPVNLPSPSLRYQRAGKVVVEITVDRDGNVSSATPGVKGSTTLNSNLLAAAKKAALASRFDRSPDAPAYQKGTITYYFTLK